MQSYYIIIKCLLGNEIWFSVQTYVQETDDVAIIFLLISLTVAWQMRISANWLKPEHRTAWIFHLLVFATNVTST